MNAQNSVSATEHNLKVIFVTNHDILSTLNRNPNENLSFSDRLDEKNKKQDSLANETYVFSSNKETMDVTPVNSITTLDPAKIIQSETNSIQLSQEELIAQFDRNLLEIMKKHVNNTSFPSKYITPCDFNEFLDNIKNNSNLLWSDSLDLEKNNEDSKINSSSAPNISQNFEKEIIDSLNKSILYNNIKEEEAVSLSWPQAYTNKFFGIDYNRNNYTEELESLIMRVIEQHKKTETQSSFVINRNMPMLKTNRFLFKRNNEQSFRKSLSFLTRRRKTFTSANFTDNKQLGLNIRKSILMEGVISKEEKSQRGNTSREKDLEEKVPSTSVKKRITRRLIFDSPTPRESRFNSIRAFLQRLPIAEAGPSRLSLSSSLNFRSSPRGKTPLGRSPRVKAPRSSIKKRITRRLVFDCSTPQKSKLESSIRTFFQTLSADQAGPSKILCPNESKLERIKKALCFTPKKEENMLTRISSFDKLKRKINDN